MHVVQNRGLNWMTGSSRDFMSSGICLAPTTKHSGTAGLDDDHRNIMLIFIFLMLPSSRCGKTLQG